MASVPYDSFLPEVLPESGSAPIPVVLNAIRNACIEFCQKSLYVNEVQAPQQYALGNAVYNITPPSGYKVAQVLDINVDGVRVVSPFSEDEASRHPTWRTEKGSIRGFVQQTNDTVRFVSVPDSGGTFEPRVAYFPARDSTGVDSRLFDIFLEGIKHGALAKLLAMVGAAWANPAVAQAHYGAFMVSVGDATRARIRSNTRAQITVTQRPFA